MSTNGAELEERELSTKLETNIALPRDKELYSHGLFERIVAGEVKFSER